MSRYSRMRRAWRKASLSSVASVQQEQHVLLRRLLQDVALYRSHLSPLLAVTPPPPTSFPVTRRAVVLRLLLFLLQVQSLNFVMVFFLIAPSASQIEL